MLDVKRFAELEGLLFTARRLVEGLYAGGHATPQAGPGVEFHDFRSYCPGDDLRAIDWKLYGRTDRLYLRRYRWFADFNAMVMIDCSASMNYPPISMTAKAGAKKQPVWTKLQYAQTLAAAIAFLTVRQSDRVGVGAYARDLVRHRPVGGTWSHLHEICHLLDAVQPIAGVGDAAAGLRHGHELMRRSGKRRGIVVLISDLLEEPSALFDGLNRLRHDRYEAIVFQVLTPGELDLSSLGSTRMRLVDLETRQQVRTHVPQVQKRYGELLRAHLDDVRRGCLNRGVDYNLLRTDQSPITALRRYVSHRSARSA